jgi:hypothetical protein
MSANPTKRIELPPDETGSVPVSMLHAEPRWFGVAPAPLLLGCALGAFVLALVLFATGSWPYGLILLGVAALLGAVYLEAARRRQPSRQPAHTSPVRERAGSVWETFRTRAAATAEAKRIQSGLFLVESERKAALLELGTAVERDDDDAAEKARATLAELEAREAELRQMLADGMAAAGERIRRVRLTVQDTVIQPPDEPYPPPDEGTPPEPAIVPEPYPPPDEGTPPQLPDPDE